MNARPATLLVLSALTLSLAACGNKGPLVLPAPPVPQEAPPAKPGEVPVTLSNANDPPVASDPKAKSALPAPPLDEVLKAPAADPSKADASGEPEPGAEPAPAEPEPAEPEPAADGQGDG